MGGQNSKALYDYVRQNISDDTPFLDDSYVNDAKKILDDCEKAGKDNNLLNLTCVEDLLRLVVETTVKATKSIKELKKENIWKDSEFCDLAKEFHDNTDSTLDFFTELEERLRKARANQLILELALAKFDEGKKDGNNYDVTVLSSTLDGVRRFREAGDPFGKDFTDLIQKIRDRHDKMSNRLKDRIRKLDKQIMKSKVKRIVLSSMFAAVFVSILAISISLVAVGLLIAPLPLSMGFFGVGLACTGLMFGGTNVHEKSKQKDIAPKKERKILQLMDKATGISVAELKSIHALIKSLESKLQHMLSSSNLPVDYNNEIKAVTIAMEQLRKLVPEFSATIDLLCGQVDKSMPKIIAARETLFNAGMPSSWKQ